jgi:hypothetical protein
MAIRVMVRSYEGLQMAVEGWTRRVVWSTWQEYATLADAFSAKWQMERGGVDAVVLLSDRDYEAFTAINRVA